MQLAKTCVNYRENPQCHQRRCCRVQVFAKKTQHILVCALNDAVADGFLFFLSFSFNWSFVWKTSVFIRLPALREKFAQNWQKYPGISAGRFPHPSRCTNWQIWWICQQIPSTPNFCQQIFWQSPHLLAKFTPQILLADFWQSPNLLADSPPPNFCWQIFWQSPNLRPISAGRVSDSHQISCQIYPCPQISAGRVSDSHQICRHDRSSTHESYNLV